MLYNIGAETATYAFTAGHRRMNHWKWLGSNERYIGETGPEYWFSSATKSKPGYDCQAMYLRDSSQIGKWVGLPCYSSASYTCEYRIAPPGTPEPANAAETAALYRMTKEAPAYLTAQSSNYKGSMAFAAPSKGSVVSLALASKGSYY